jgi:hypothetical protein
MSANADVPFVEACEQAQRIINQGGEVFQRFTCATCGSRQSIETPNVFHMTATCEECKSLTNILERGCGFLAVFGKNLPNMEKSP